MDEILPYITGDGSIGLFNQEYDDIYHSSCGALTEAYEKFVNPITVTKDEIRVLDVCYGLGYNSKAFLNTNADKKIIFDCLDIDKYLIFLSPFIKTNHSFFDFFINRTKNIKFSKYINRGMYKKYKIEDWVNAILIKNIHNQFKDEFSINKILSDKKFYPYLNKNIIKIAKFYQKNGYKDIKSVNKLAFLHNIYYRYVSKRDITFYFYVDDARKTVKNLNYEYDYIFLDAFTTNKCPQLWSIDFIKELYRLTSPDGVLLTYSNSIVVRQTLLEAGYFIGKIINEDNKQIGTIASRDKNKITNELTEYELGLLKTKAGIPYRDSSLDSSIEEILSRRELEVKNSNLMSSSRYIKQKGVLK